ncbi:YlbF family regulator [Halobacillus salinus]|uniref:YlbF family regulator n=1 Tax=Halobacillus salinus TaxID=192814 RepID=UPI0009A69C62|nr:YlbF family regulator [Halobacillus salinus]
MTIFWHEMKKIWNPKVLSGIVLISLLFYQLFLSFHFENFPNGRPALDHYQISIELIEDFGPSLNESEYTQVQEWYSETIQEAKEYLRTNETANQLNISSYQLLQRELSNTERGTEEYKKVNQLYTEIYFEDEVNAFWKIQAYENLMNEYDDKEALSEQTGIESNFESILPSVIYDNFQTLILYTGVLVLIAVVILLGRVHLPDQRKNMLPVQYVTKKGRSLFQVKLFASLVTTLVVTTAYLGAFFVLYSRNGIGMFLESSLYSFQLSRTVLFWYDLTFGQYIGITIAIIYGAALCGALSTLIFSRLASHYTALVGTLIPIATGMVLVLATFLLFRLFSMEYPLWTYWVGIILLPTSCLSFYLWRSRKESTVDII